MNYFGAVQLVEGLREPLAANNASVLLVGAHSVGGPLGKRLSKGSPAERAPTEWHYLPAALVLRFVLGLAADLRLAGDPAPPPVLTG